MRLAWTSNLAGNILTYFEIILGTLSNETEIFVEIVFLAYAYFRSEAK